MDSVSTWLSSSVLYKTAEMSFSQKWISDLGCSEVMLRLFPIEVKQSTRCGRPTWQKTYKQNPKKRLCLGVVRQAGVIQTNKQIGVVL